MERLLIAILAAALSLVGAAGCESCLSDSGGGWSAGDEGGWSGGDSAFVDPNIQARAEMY